MAAVNLVIRASEPPPGPDRLDAEPQAAVKLWHTVDPTSLFSPLPHYFVQLGASSLTPGLNLPR